MQKHFLDIANKELHIAAYQEITVPEGSLDGAKHRLTKEGWASDLSKCCPEAARPTGGVGACVRHPGNVTELEPRTEI